VEYLETSDVSRESMKEILETSLISNAPFSVGFKERILD
jgi:hypothetical protein